MAGIMTALGTMAEIFTTIDKEGVSGKGLIKMLKSKELKLLKSDGSIIKLLGSYIVEPVCIISKSLKEEEVMDQVIGLHTDLFTGFYMQAFDVLRAHYGLDDNEVIDVLSTDTGGLQRALLQGAEIALEDRDFLGTLINADIKLSIEDSDTMDFSKELRQTRRDDAKFKRDKDYKREVEIDKRMFDMAKTNDERAYKEGRTDSDRKYEYSSRDKSIVGASMHEGSKDLLIPNAMQRTIELTITRPLSNKDGSLAHSDLTIVIPLTIKTHVIYTDIDSIINILRPNSDDKTFFSRLDEYRAGAVSMYDMMFATDLIKKYKTNKLKDKDELFKLINSRTLSANSKMATYGYVGFEKYYNMYIISADDKIILEKFLKGKLSKSKYKDKFLEQGYGLSLTVMDQDYERVIMMIKDLRGTTNLTFKAILKSDKKGNDIAEIVKALVANRPPVF